MATGRWSAQVPAVCSSAVCVAVHAWVYGWSEGFARVIYFVPGCDGLGSGQIQKVVSQRQRHQRHP